MTLNEYNYQDCIWPMTKQQWRPLLDLIPEIENTSVFGEMVGNIEDEGEDEPLPYWIFSEIVERFCELVYNLPIIIEFDWPNWDEGRKIASDESFDFDTIDIATKCKLITALIINDRFCDGALILAFETGLILKILNSIEKQVSEEPIILGNAKDAIVIKPDFDEP